MQEKLELIPYIWPVTRYAVSEFFKRILSDSVKIKSSHGEIIGFEMSSPFGFRYKNFLGVPYAKPPIGNLRFKVSKTLLSRRSSSSIHFEIVFQDPEPLEPWTQPLRATRETTPSQKDVFVSRYVGMEDCLHMNIYTKDVKPIVLQPVMVYLYGGSFIFGSNAKYLYNPEYLLRKDVVVIVINYRLGIFGKNQDCDT